MLDMVLYSQNPSLKLKTITTVNGNTEYRRNCRYIRGQYYLMNEDCFEINGTWYRKESSAITFDHSTKKWVIKKETALLNGIVAVEKDKFIKGDFSADIYNNCTLVVNGEKVPVMNVDIIKDTCFEDLGTGVWYVRKEVTDSNFKKMTTIRNAVNFTNRGYNIEDNKVDFERKKEALAAYKVNIDKEISSYSKMLGSTTFGLELEVAKGYLPENIQYQTGIVICRDGSINGGPEFVTVPLQGAKGVQVAKTACKEITKRGEIDINCSLHIHLGNYPSTRSSIVSLYMLGLKIQDELFEMFPYYKTDPTGIKRKNYNQKLKRMSIHPLKNLEKDDYKVFVDDVYTKIFTFLTDGQHPDDAHNRRNREHPVSQKWNRTNRYYWLNLMNMFFSSRNTIEFRLK